MDFAPRSSDFAFQTCQVLRALHEMGGSCVKYTNLEAFVPHAKRSALKTNTMIINSLIFLLSLKSSVIICLTKESFKEPEISVFQRVAL